GQGAHSWGARGLDVGGLVIRNCQRLAADRHLGLHRRVSGRSLRTYEKQRNRRLEKERRGGLGCWHCHTRRNPRGPAEQKGIAACFFQAEDGIRDSGYLLERAVGRGAQGDRETCGNQVVAQGADGLAAISAGVERYAGQSKSVEMTN